MSTLLETYKQLLGAAPGKWINAAGEVCYSFMDNGLSICSFIDENNVNCISLYKIDSNGMMQGEITLRENADLDLFREFSDVYKGVKSKVEKERFQVLQQKLSA